MRLLPLVLLVVSTAALAVSTAALAADFVPSGPDALPRLLGRDAFEDVSRSDVARTVEKQGFWAGEPIGISQCASCHADAAAQWSGSAHRFASFDNPYYTRAVEDFRKERGNVASRFCAGCHDPALVSSGRIDAAIDHHTREAQAGIVCLTCHSIADHPTRSGNGDFTAKLDPWPTSGGAHGARLRPATMAASAFCGTCHRVGLTSDVTHARWLRGQDEQHAWTQSSFSGNGPGSIHRAPATKRCQDCHMPMEVAALGDAAAHLGPDGVKRIRSHRFVGANTALAHVRHDDAQEARTVALLQSSVSLALVQPEGPRLVDVVLRSRGVGHRFPGGTMDSNEAWVDVRAYDDKGTLLAESGALDAHGDLGREAHLVRAQQVDGDGVPLLRRDVQHARGVVYDTALDPGDPQAVRYELPQGTTRVDARLQYRKLSAEYTRYACADIAELAVRRTCETPPVVEVAHASLVLARDASLTAQCDALPWETVLDHGIALAAGLADRADEASGWLACAARREPRRIEPVLGQARLALLLGQTERVLELARAAATLDSRHPAPDYLSTVALLRAYRNRPARRAAEKLFAKLPHDPTTLALVSRARGLDGDPRGALTTSAELLQLDPESEDGHLQRALSLRDLHRQRESTEEEVLYERYRSATEDNLALRERYRRWSGQLHDESEPLHTHVLLRAPRDKVTTNP
ncbi:MAG: multiheme c-type cytochrome [Polyangia bacterium]